MDASVPAAWSSRSPVARAARAHAFPAWCWTCVPMATLAGTGAVHLLTALPDARAWTWWAAVMLALGLPMVGFRRWRRHWLAWALLAGGFAFGGTAWRAAARMAEVLPVAMEGQVVPLVGRVGSLPQRSSGMGGVEGWRFVFEVDESAIASIARDVRAASASASPGNAAATANANASIGTGTGTGTGAPPAIPKRLLLSCYQMPSPPRAGELWRLEIKLRRPHGLMNPHGFDQALWMLEQDLPAAGSCRGKGQARLADGGWGITALRQSLRDAIDVHLRDHRGAGVLSALSLGDQGAVGVADWTLYRDTGVAHLLSVSGLHVTMFAWIASAVGGWCWRRSGRWCLRWPAPRAAMWIGTAAAGLYALFSGWGVPAQRTFGLLLILALLRQAGARWPWVTSLAVAAAGVCLADPWALTQPGFWLSFCAVALLMAADLPTGGGWRGALHGAWRTQWLVTLGLTPLTLLLFQQVSIVGLLANAVAIPLVSYVITPLAMLGSVVAPLWTLGAWLVVGLNAFLELLRSLPLSVWHLPWAPGWAQALGLVGGVMLALPWPWRLRLGGLALCVPMLWPVVDRPAPGQLELWVPDVGQGGAVIVRTHRRTLAYDSGPRWGPGSDAAQRVLLPLLRGLGERRLDLLMVSHADQDHAGGTASLLRAMAVSGRLGLVPEGEPCVRGQHWIWDGVRFDVLSPEEGDDGPRPDRKRNGASCVLRIEAAGRRVLLTGDIETPQETRLLRRDGTDGLEAEVIVVPHHGSRTSSSAAFVQAVAPAVALVQSGHLNRFGHPKAEVVARYEAVGATLLNTVDCGAWRWRSDQMQAPSDGCERSLRRRYWLRAPTMGGEDTEMDEAPPAGGTP